MHYFGLYKNLIKTIASLTNILSIAFCKSNLRSALDEMIFFNPASQPVDINIEEGCIINPLTLNGIQSIINSLVDAVKNAVPVQATGNVIDPGYTAKSNLILI